MNKVLKVTGLFLVGILTGKLLIDKNQSSPTVLHEKTNYIKLSFSNRKSLYGRDVGVSTWKVLVEPQIRENVENIVVFPENIRTVSSSFVQGFVSKYVEAHGYNELKENIRVVFLGNDKLTEKFWDNLF